jgi:hypothetical protein
LTRLLGFSVLPSGLERGLPDGVEPVYAGMALPPVREVRHEKSCSRFAVHRLRVWSISGKRADGPTAADKRGRLSTAIGFAVAIQMREFQAQQRRVVVTVASHNDQER